jgi:hypothetical protein
MSLMSIDASTKSNNLYSRNTTESCAWPSNLGTEEIDRLVETDLALASGMAVAMRDEILPISRASREVVRTAPDMADLLASVMEWELRYD